MCPVPSPRLLIFGQAGSKEQTLCSPSPLLRVLEGFSPQAHNLGVHCFSYCIFIRTAMETNPPLPSSFFVFPLTAPKPHPAKIQAPGGLGIIQGAKRDGSGGQKHGGTLKRGSGKGQPRALGRVAEAEPCCERGSAAIQPRGPKYTLCFSCPLKLGHFLNPDYRTTTQTSTDLGAAANCIRHREKKRKKKKKETRKKKKRC